MTELEAKNPPIVGFDVDGTLFTSFTTDIVAGLESSFARLKAAGVRQTFIATNQAGPVWRKMTNHARYPTVRRIAQILVAASDLLLKQGDLEVALFVAAHPGDHALGSDWQQAADIYAATLTKELQKKGCRAAHIEVNSNYNWRKPRPGMLLAAAHYYNRPPHEILFIGDTPEADQAAAANAGARFIHIQDWVSSLALEI